MFGEASAHPLLNSLSFFIQVFGLGTTSAGRSSIRPWGTPRRAREEPVADPDPVRCKVGGVRSGEDAAPVLLTPFATSTARRPS